MFETLDVLEEHLGKHKYLMGDRLTESDWRLFTTLLRFDLVYVGHFKCNLRRIADYLNLSRYLSDLCQIPGIADTINIQHIKGHYYQSHAQSIQPASSPWGPLRTSPRAWAQSFVPNREEQQALADLK